MNKQSNYITIYEQRYETYRHLDKLRWFIFQIGISVIGAIISFQHIKGSTILGVSFILISTGLVMLKIDHGIDMNNIALKKVATKLGDNTIPDIHKRHKFKSMSWFVAYSLTIIGTILFFLNLFLLIKNKNLCRY